MLAPGYRSRPAKTSTRFPLMDKSELINQLRIDRKKPDPPILIPWKVLIGVMALALIGAALGWMFKAGGPIPVKTAPVISASNGMGEASILDATGYVVARRQATVSAKITGKIRDVHIEEGLRVEADAVLAELDDTDTKAQLALAQAQLQAARSQRADLQVLLAQAERDQHRQQELVGRKLTSQQAAEQARSAVNSYRARIAAQDRQIEVAEESVRVAQVNVDNTIIRAPFAGVIVAKTAQPGEIVSPMSAGGGFTRTGIGTIVDMDSLEIEVDVNEAFIGRVRPQQPVNARLNAYPDWNVPAEVIAIIPTADRTKATVKVRIALLAKDARIVPEMGVRVAFLEQRQDMQIASRSPAMLVPESAIQVAGDVASLFAVVDGKVQRRAVKLGERQGSNREVLAGVRAGERVILNPTHEIRDGIAVVDAPPQ
jgi:RND family efflux transporter MFP subunit